MKRNGIPFVLTGPSGSGKTTVLNEVVKTLDNLSYSISHTTREPRAGEDSGKDYHFVSTAVFDRMIAAGEFVEYATVYEHKYGTAKSSLIAMIEGGRDIVLDLDVIGAQNIRKAIPRSVLIFLLPPSLPVLKRRLSDRHTDSVETINLRFSRALSEMKALDNFAYMVRNTEISLCVAEINSIIGAERARVANYPNLAANIEQFLGGADG